MDERLRRVLFITGFLIIVAGLAWGLYYLFFRPLLPVVAPPTATTTLPGGQLPGAGTGRPATTTTPGGPGVLPVQPGTPFQPSLPTGLETPGRVNVLRQEITRSISVSSNGQVRGYNPADGRFYRIDQDGNAVPMSNQVFNGVDQVDWGNSSDKAVLTFPDGSNIMYDFTTNQQVTLPRHWEDFEFSPQDDKIVAKSVGNNADNRFLVVSNPDGSNARTVEDLGDNEERVHSSWSPNNQVIAYSFTGEPLGMDRQQVLLLGQNRENFKGLVIEGRGFIPKWSPSGNNLLYSVYTSSNSYRPSLWVSGASGDSINENRRNLQISTWADKCAWLSESSMVCGVPRTMPAGAGLQRDVAAGIVDDIYRLNLETGEVINLGEAQGASVQEISVTPDGSAAVFTDANSGRLIRFDL